LASRKLEDRLDQLRRLRAGPLPADLDIILSKAFSDRSNLVIAEAAKTVGELRLSAWIPQLLSTFEKLFEDPVKTDPKCWGKTAIVKALVQLDYSDSAPFVRGMRHIQREPVYGGQEDSAPHVRANCVLALVQTTDITRIEMLRLIVDALNDAGDPVRVEAVRALNQVGGDEAVLLLRLKARLGDRRPLILGHVFDALLNMERERSVALVAEYLNSSDDEVRDEAALALGASRLAGAVTVLIEAWKHVHSDIYSGVLLRAISSSRLTEAIEFLLGLVRTGTSRQSAAALEALKLHEGTPEIQLLIEAARRERGR
jgi:HEAT repeat protein